MDTVRNIVLNVNITLDTNLVTWYSKYALFLGGAFLLPVSIYIAWQKYILHNVIHNDIYIVLYIAYAGHTIPHNITYAMVNDRPE